MKVLRSPWGLIAPLGVSALLVAWVALSAANAQAVSFSVVLFALANLIVYTDALDFLLRVYVRRRHTATARGTERQRDLSIDLAPAMPLGMRRVVSSQSYAIIASVYNLEERLDEFMEAFEPYRNRVWLISDGSTDDTLQRLRQAGWRCFDDGVNRHKPGAIKRLLERLPDFVETVLVVDPDIRIRGRAGGSTIDLEQFVAEFQQSGAAAACPRVMIEPDGWLARFQAFEYCLAFRVGRESLADYSITSGVSLYRRDALTNALNRHSLSVYAEDFENAVLLLSHGERVYYDGRLIVSTEGPGLLRRWFSQRVGWYYGLLKVYTERFGAVWHTARRTPFAFYHYIIYVGVLSLGLHVVKIVSAVLLVISFASGFDNLFLTHLIPVGSVWTNPVYFMTAIGSYLALGVIALFTVVPKAERAYVAPIVPLYLFYALVHIIPMSLGFANWVGLKLWGRRVYRDHYEPGESPSVAVAGQVLARRLE
jgi:cellulose synthase/poly-beta-1,6-N-acetylglucosamine synthase-like glycosyltransferase